MYRLWQACRWWWVGEELSTPDVLIAREGEERWRKEVERLREEVKARDVLIEAKDSELAIRKRDVMLMAEIIKREQVRVQAETAMAAIRADVARRE